MPPPKDFLVLVAEALAAQQPEAVGRRVVECGFPGCTFRASAMTTQAVIAALDGHHHWIRDRHTLEKS